MKTSYFFLYNLKSRPLIFKILIIFILFIKKNDFTNYDKKIIFLHYLKFTSKYFIKTFLYLKSFCMKKNGIILLQYFSMKLQYFIIITPLKKYYNSIKEEGNERWKIQIPSVFNDKFVKTQLWENTYKFLRRKVERAAPAFLRGYKFGSSATRPPLSISSFLSSHISRKP